MVAHALRTDGPRRPSKGLEVIDELMRASDQHEALKRRNAGLDEVRRMQIAMHQLEETVGGESVVDLLEQIALTASAGSAVPSASLTDEQEEVLQRAGSLADTMPPLSERPSTATALRRFQIITDSLSVGEVATSLSVSESRIRQRVSERSLLAIRTPAGMRFPRFQFFQDGELPGWDEVAPHFPEDVHPVAVRVFLHSPTSELELDGESVSPYVWLAEGGAAAPIAALVDASYQLP